MNLRRTQQLSYVYAVEDKKLLVVSSHRPVMLNLRRVKKYNVL